MTELLKKWIIEEFTRFQDSGEMEITCDGRPAIRQVYITSDGLSFFDNAVVSDQVQFAEFTKYKALIVESTKVVNTDYFIGLEIGFESKHFTRGSLENLDEYPIRILHASNRVRKKVANSQFAAFIISQEDPLENDYYLEVNIYFILTA